MCLGVILFFVTITAWFKSGFETIELDNEAYELNREIKSHYKDFLAKYDKSYSSQEEHDAREQIYIANYVNTRH